jgi:hypothetical protein
MIKHFNINVFLHYIKKIHHIFLNASFHLGELTGIGASMHYYHMGALK